MLSRNPTLVMLNIDPSTWEVLTLEDIKIGQDLTAGLTHFSLIKLKCLTGTLHLLWHQGLYKPIKVVGDKYLAWQEFGVPKGREMESSVRQMILSRGHLLASGRRL